MPDRDGSAKRPLAKRRILLVEDQTVVALEVEALLQELGCEVVGPLATVTRALAAARTEELDGAILDVNLFGESVYPVAEALQARRIPFLLATGYDAGVVPPRFLDHPILEKPYIVRELKDSLLTLWTPSTH